MPHSRPHSRPHSQPAAQPGSPAHTCAISEKQRAANQRNAQHSTGPKTPQGKQNSSFNALRHGLYARDVVLPGEDRGAFDELLENLNAELKPEGTIEQGFVRRIADIWWRLGRTAAIEAGLLNPSWSGDPRASRMTIANEPLIDGFRVAIDETKTLDRLGRYESRLERALSRTLAMLQRMQTTRRRASQAGRIEPGTVTKE